MTVEINCTSHIRELLGTKRFHLEIPSGELEIGIGEVLRHVENQAGGRVPSLMEDDHFMKGLLVFKRTGEGGLERITDSSAPVSENDSLTLATGMEGG